MCQPLSAQSILPTTYPCLNKTLICIDRTVLKYSFVSSCCRIFDPADTRHPHLSSLACGSELTLGVNVILSHPWICFRERESVYHCKNSLKCTDFAVETKPLSEWARLFVSKQFFWHALTFKWSVVQKNYNKFKLFYLHFIPQRNVGNKVLLHYWNRNTTLELLK